MQDANQFEFLQLLCIDDTTLVLVSRDDLEVGTSLDFNISTSLGLEMRSGCVNAASKTEFFFFPLLGCFKPNLMSGSSPVNYSNLRKSSKKDSRAARIKR